MSAHFAHQPAADNESPVQKRNPRRQRKAFAVAFAALIAFTGLSVTTNAPAEAARKVRRVGPDFTLIVSPDSIRVSSGQRAVFPLFVQAVRGFKSVPRFDIDGVPSYIDAEIVTLGTNRYQLELIVPNNAPTSNGVYKLIATSGSRRREALFRLVVDGPTATIPPVTQPPVTQPPATQPPVTQPPATIPAAPVFGLRADATERNAATGDTAIFGFSVDRSSGYNGQVTLAVTGVPNGASFNFAPNPTTSNTNLYITPSASTPSGRYVLSVTATAGSTQRVAAVALTVLASADFAMIANPTSRSISTGTSTTYKIDLATTANKPNVTFNVQGIPIGASAKFSANSSQTGTTLTVTVGSATPVGKYPLTVTGVSGTFIRQLALELNVGEPVGFGLSATPNKVDLPRNTTNNKVLVNLSVVPKGGFNGTIGIASSPLPAGVKLTIGSANGSTVPLTFEADATAAVGTSTVKIRGIAGTLSAEISVIINVI
jgi:hypothetical protein